MSEDSTGWLNDPEYVDRRTEIELSSRRYTRVFWDADILDIDKHPHDTFVDTGETFLVRFRVELRGQLWKCASGTWTFDVGFTAIGPGAGFYLSSLLPGNPDLQFRDWRGCDTLFIERIVTVPAGTIEIKNDSALFEAGANATFQCCDDNVVLSAYTALEEYEFFKGR